MKKALLGGVAAAILATVAPALAQGPAAQGARADRVQTRADLQVRIQKQFARVDANRDGAITQAEVQALQARKAERQAKRGERAQRRDPAQRFARLDANRDGQITRAEYDARIAARAQRQAAAGKPARNGERLFARLDTNRDGAISQAEFQVRGQARAERQDRRAERRANRPARQGRFGGHMFTMADANRDARVTLQEATSAALRHFDMADVNKDGQVTREERRQMRQQMRGHAGHQG